MYANMERVEFKNFRGLNIVGILDKPETAAPYPIVLALHGFGGNKESGEEWPEIFLPLGIAVLRIDFSGSGESDGKYEEKTVTDFLDDTKSALDFICELEEVNKNMIAVVGHSMGGCVTILSAARDERVKTAVASVPAIKVGEVIAGLYSKEELIKLEQQGYVETTKFGDPRKLNKTFFDDAKNYDLAKEGQGIPYKFLVLGAAKDTVVPLEQIKEFCDKTPNAVLATFPNSDHNLEEDWPEIENRIRDWFSNWISKK